MKRLAGKTALITGGARGIGRAFASAYVREGAQVVLADINLPQAQQSAEEIGATAIAMDVRDLDSIRDAVTEAEAQLGQIDILINNAAVFNAAPLVEITPGDYAQVFDVNVKGTLFTMQTVAQQMIRRGIAGKIINMASQAGRRGEPLVAVYCASKAAVISLTQSAGLNLIQHGINVNAISPGVVDGAHWDEVDRYFAHLESKAHGQKKNEVGSAVPYGRMGRAEDLTGMAVFLASEEADYIVAQTYNVDGGQWMS